MKLLKQIRRSIYVRQVATLLTGSIIAQLISLGSAPALTRLYEPKAFGDLALFLAIVSAIAPGVSGRYETAVIVVRDEQARRQFFFIALWFAAAVCIFFAVALLFGHRQFSTFIGAEGLGIWLWITPVALFLVGAIAILQSFSNAEKEYGILSRSTVAQTASVAFIGLALGLYGFSSNGLLMANVGGLLIASVYLLYRYRYLFIGDDWKWQRPTFELALKHKDYPLFNATTNILNGIMTGLPVFFLAKFFSDSVVGYYALLVRVGVAPLSLISGAVSRVNLKKIAEVIQEREDPIPYLAKITATLALLSALPTVILVLIAPELFAWAFGENWREAGVLLVILMPALAVQFVASTLSMSFVAAGRLRLQAAWQIFSLAISLIVFYQAALSGDIYHFFWVFMIKDILLYLLYYAMLVYALKNPINVHQEV